MKLFFWKNNQPIDTFAKSLADDFFSDTQPPVADRYFTQPDSAAPAIPAAGKKPDDHITPQKALAQHKHMERRIQDLALKLSQFKAQQKLGVYGKARLHLTFTERLEELGFSKDTVQQLNRILLLKAP